MGARGVYILQNQQGFERLLRSLLGEGADQTSGGIWIRMKRSGRRKVLLRLRNRRF